MLKKKMAAGVVALAMFSTLGLAACNPGGSSSDSSSGGSTAAGSIPEPDVACDIPAGNLDDSKIDTSKVEGEITFQTQGLQTTSATSSRPRSRNSRTPTPVSRSTGPTRAAAPSSTRP